MPQLQYPKRLIEVDLPIKRISAHSRREKDMRRGHVPLLHIWPATRPPAACRAVLCASLWPDPADELCPDSFREKARELMQQWANKHLKLLSAESYSRFIAYQKDPDKLKNNEELRKALLDFIADFANWDNSTVKEYLEASRQLTQTAHEALGGQPGTKPLVVDPFAGAGAIPLEALRIGADSFASELNPVAVLLNKVVIEYIPKYGRRLSNEVRRWGNWVKEETEKELAEFYPKDPDGAIPVAYLWARTILCEGPSCGCEVPLIHSLWLARKRKQPIALKLIPKPKEKCIDLEIANGVKPKEIGAGTIRRGAATCPCCGYTTPIKSVRKQLRANRGGAANARMLCVATIRPDVKGRFYRLPSANDLAAVEKAKVEIESRDTKSSAPLSLIPREPTPEGGGRGAGRAFGQRNYGMDSYDTAFTPRQLLVLTTIVQLTKKYCNSIAEEFSNEFVEAVRTIIGLVVDKMVDMNSALCVWQTHAEIPAHVFGRWAWPTIWDFAEANPLAGSSGSFEAACKRTIDGIDHLAKGRYVAGHSVSADAASHPLPDDCAMMFATDPPYYDAIPYGDISDFFYVWLKRLLYDSHAGLFKNVLSEKENECIVDDARGKDRNFFLDRMTKAMEEGRRILAPDGIGFVVFAHKSTVGWEAQLRSMIDAGWIITSSWPIDTEMRSRLRAKNSAALASSIHLICRPRENPDGSVITNYVGDWRDVLQELPKRIHEWMPRLAEEGVVGADAIFACLGPALEVFSRYSKVEKASGEEVTLREYLEHVWAAVAKEALNMIFAGADAAGFEEDSRLTAMWLWTLSTETNGNGQKETADEKTAKSVGYTLEFDAARKIAQGLGAHLEKLGRMVEIKGDKARLLSVAERTKYLFGKDESQAPVGKRKKKDSQMQLDFMAEVQKAEREEGGWGEKNAPRAGDTVLDQLHQAMILFAAGRGEAMKRFLVEEGIGRDGRFWRLAQAFSALYPSGTDEKRWVDGVLARKKGLGF